MAAAAGRVLLPGRGEDQDHWQFLHGSFWSVPRQGGLSVSLIYYSSFSALLSLPLSLNSPLLTPELLLPFTSISALLLFFSFSFLRRLYLICPFSFPILLFSSYSCPSSCRPGVRGQLAPPQRAGPLRSVHAGDADAHQCRHRKQLPAASG